MLRKVTGTIVAGSGAALLLAAGCSSGGAAGINQPVSVSLPPAGQVATIPASGLRG